MTTKTTTKLLISAVIAAGLAFAPAAFAEDAMKKTGDSKPMADKMKKDDGMKKSDNMKKPMMDDKKGDAMKK